MATQLEICNMAMRMVGEEPITSEYEDTKAAEALRNLWDICYEEVLERHSWGFAQKRAALAAEVDPPDFGYAYRFLCPADPQKLVGVTMINESVDTDFRVEGGYILLDSETCNLQYTAKVEIALAPGTFANSLATIIASRLAYNLSGGRGRAMELLQLYEISVVRAIQSDAKNNVGISQDEEAAVGVGTWLAREA
jgi:hypothetical protein